MADDPDSEKLREMAEHRGLKLIKSRRRKPGAGDYGKFGLTDAAGKPLLGIGDDGLTASASDIAAYLRAGTLGTWQKSASTTPDRPRPKQQPPAPPTAAAPTRPKSRTKPETPVPKPPPKPAPRPQLVIRPAKSADGEAIASLLSRLPGVAIDDNDARKNLTSVQKTGGGMLLAELGEPIGCCGWAIVPTVQHGPIGRITVLFVDRDHRRDGVASQLLAATEPVLATAGCTMVEAMSDIQINNAHNFFRALKFKQASYRFVRKLKD